MSFAAWLSISGRPCRVWGANANQREITDAVASVTEAINKADGLYDQYNDFGVKLTNRAGTVSTGVQEEVGKYTSCFYPSYQFLIDWNGDSICEPQVFEFILSQPDTLPSIVIDTIIQMEPEDLCANNAEGIINISITGGTPPYDLDLIQYNNSVNGYSIIEQISNSNDTSYSFANLAPGDYSVSLYDDNYNGTNSCSDFAADMTIIGVEEPLETAYDLLTYYSCNFNTSCIDSNDGEITVIASGLEPFLYTLYSNEPTPSNLIENNSSGQFNQLSPGLYSVIVTDGITCGDTILDIELNAPESPLTIELTAIDTATFCLNNGEVTAIVEGGCGVPYTYSLCESDQNGNIIGVCDEQAVSNNTITFSGIGAGFYTITVSDGLPNEDGSYNCAITEIIEMI